MVSTVLCPFYRWEVEAQGVLVADKCRDGIELWADTELVGLHSMSSCLSPPERQRHDLAKGQFWGSRMEKHARQTQWLWSLGDCWARNEWAGEGSCMTSSCGFSNLPCLKG